MAQASGFGRPSVTPSKCAPWTLPSPVALDRSAGRLVFPDFPDFQPNLAPKQVLQAGAFGGTYFRPIHSAITGNDYADDWREFPADWFEGLDEAKVRACAIAPRMATAPFN